jgi:lipopolysaccharide assembly protein A
VQPASKLLYWLIALPIGLIVIVFSVSNRDGVLVSFSPLPYEMSIPLFLLVFIVFVVGVLVGGLLGWMGGHGARRRARERKHRIAELETALRQAEQKRDPAPAAPALAAPAAANPDDKNLNRLPAA